MQSLDQEMNEEEMAEATPDERKQKFSNPFSPPSGIQDDIPPDHPSLDEVQTEEWYDEGRTGASGVHDQDERS